MTIWSSAHLEQTTRRRARLAAGADDDALLAAARGPRQKMAALLASARVREQRPMPDSWHAFLDAQRRRVDLYARTVDLVRDDVPGVRVVKGASIASHYPHGLLRGAGDVDLWCPTPDDRWAAARRLRGAGWYVTALTVFARGTAPEEVLVSLRTDALGGDHPPGLTLATTHVATNPWAPPVRLPPSSPRVIDLACVVAEQWEQGVRTRDILDQHLLTRAFTADEHRALDVALAHAGMRHLHVRLRAAAAAHLDDARPSRSGGARTDAARQAARVVRHHLRPARVVARALAPTVDVDRGRVLDLVADRFHAHGGTARAMRAGRPAFGVPVDERTVPVPAVEHRQDRSFLHSPLGTFRLVVGSCLDD